MSHHAEPMHRKVRFFSPGTLLLLAIMATGYAFGLARFLVGLGPVTNLTNAYPWGIWIAIDVATGVALAAGGFVTAALVNVFGRERYHDLERPALLTAWLGYSFVAFGLLFDLGRPYNIWRPLFNWQGNSVLFEVGMCVMFYLGVLTVEMLPTILGGLAEGMRGDSRLAATLRRLDAPVRTAQAVVRRILPVFIILGVVLSCMHQSSLGGLMLIAPTKLSPIWWTPILPVLFLLSAIMVGLPMVVFESMFSARSFGRKPEMELLTPVSRIIPWLIALYGTVKLTDFFVRNDLSVLLVDPVDTIAWLLEVGLGLVVPFVMLTRAKVRRSTRSLFVAVALVIGGVVANRINVFITGFHPPHASSRYLPALGEVAITAGLIATIIFLYRVVAWLAPVLPSEGDEPAGSERRQRVRSGGRVTAWVWALRGLTAAMVLGFIAAYAAVHVHAIEASARYTRPNPPRITGTGPHRERPAPDAPPSFSAEQMPSYLVLASELANKARDDYEPVRFLHRAHAVHVDGDCTVCHHRVQEQEGDRLGREIDQVSMGSFRPSTCGACHRDANEPDAPQRPGLKGAYHEQCIGCHEQSGEATAPTDCRGCHARYVPDHKALVELRPGATPTEVTRTCLRCHDHVAHDVMSTSHWRWSGASPDAVGREHARSMGKLATINSYCIAVTSNMESCSQCHIGYGTFADASAFEDPSRIDCLACHDTSGTYARAESGGGVAAGVDLVAAAQSAGRSTRKACGACHFFSDGEANQKHGDLGPELTQPEASLDVHMGRADLRCEDCHTTERHEISGKASTLPTSANRLRCEQCHGEKPHAYSGVMARHLDDHVSSVSCQACHIPAFARGTPTKMTWDWSKAGQDLPAAKDALDLPTFDQNPGASTWAKDVLPTYRWWNGRTRHYEMGQPIATEGPTVLAGPSGDRADSRARIHPFKRFEAVQPIDAKARVLAIPNLWDGFWLDFDWDKALRVGMAAAGMAYSGEHAFAPTETWHAIQHTVAPREGSLRCRDCHEEEAVACARCHGHDENGPEETCGTCHGDDPRFDATAQLGPGYDEGAGTRMDWKALGYQGDPAVVGGRFRSLPQPALKAPAAEAEEPAE